MRHPWLFSSFVALKSKYQKLMNRVEQDLELKATGLPVAANWTNRLTQILLIGIVTGAGWSVLARVDVVVNSRGKLEPLSQSQVIQSRAGGTVTHVLVHEGEQVKRGQLLMRLDKTGLNNRLQTLLVQRKQLNEEIAVLRLSRQGKSLSVASQRSAGISPELINQVQTRLLLVAQLTGDPSGLDAEQRQRFNLYQQQLRDRKLLTHLQESNIQTQIGETDVQISQTQFQLQTEQELLSRIKPLVEQGAIARTTLLQRRVNVNDLQEQQTQSNLKKQQLALGQLQTRVEESKAFNDIQQDLQHQLSELDAKFNAIIKDNQRQLIEINSQLRQVQLDLKNQDLRAPVDGVVFNLSAKLPGVVAQPGQTLLQVVPNESLTAQVQVANADIGNIRVGMPVDIRIDAYPFTEFGSVKGSVLKVGRESMQVSQEASGSTAFPVEIRLDRQYLDHHTERLTLTPGMSVAAMIQVRQRAPISYVTEEITKAFDSLKTIR
jgi:hemolysin D